MRHRTRRAGAAAAIVTAAAVALGACSGDDGAGITVAPVGRATVTEVVEAPATVSAKASAQVSAGTDASVAAVQVREGQQVRAGQVLVRLDSPQARRSLRQAVRADAQAAQAGSVTTPAVGLSAQQQQADVTARRAFARARRAAAAITDRATRRQALAAVAASRAQYDAARTQAADAVRQFQAGLGSLSGAVAALSSAQRVQTRAAVIAARRTVQGLVIRAPISGTVSLTATPSGSGSTSAADLVDQLPESLQGQAGSLLGGSGSSSQVSGTLAEGQPVSSGQALVTVTDSSTLSLTAQVDETDVLLVRRGVPAEVELDAVPDATYDATVVTVDPTPTTSSRGGVTYVVRLSLDRGRETGGTIAPTPRAGMSAVARLRVRTAHDVVSAPASAVFRDGRRDAVWVVVNGRARQRTVQLGAQGESRVQVLSGLKEGERLVGRGADRLREGQQVP